MLATQRYRPSLALLTDLYQITMAAGYVREGMAERRASFTLSFRNNPFKGGYAVACGLADAADFLANLRFTGEDIDYVRTLKGNDGRPLFDDGFLQWLRDFRLTCDVDAMPEGTVCFPHEPLVRVTGPLAQCQLLETPLLTMINFGTLIATKASRVRWAAGTDRVLEFGMRRAQGIDGALSVARASYIGGCDATSDVLAGRLYGIPVAGTHAHSWVMSFGDELEAFRAYADAMPNNATFLVDTYDTLQGVRHAVEVGRTLRERGHRLAGIRLDSGDLAYLSIGARKILDEAGFTDAKILASSELDERLIQSLKLQGAKIDIWGVGTKLATAFDQPALGGVYKLGAIQDADGRWVRRIKLSEQAVKVNNPGILQVRRFGTPENWLGDAIWDELTPPPPGDWTIVDPADPTRRKVFAAGTPWRDVLVPVFRGGERVLADEPIEEARERCRRELGGLHPSIRRFDNPHGYPAGLELGLHDLKMDLILRARGLKGGDRRP
jgi:nicotinate phosphoribosyltransferase